MITVSHSFIVTANAMRYCGAELVFVGFQPEPTTSIRWESRRATNRTARHPHSRTPITDYHRSVRAWPQTILTVLTQTRSRSERMRGQCERGRGAGKEKGGHGKEERDGRGRGEEKEGQKERGGGTGGWGEGRGEEGGGGGGGGVFRGGVRQQRSSARFRRLIRAMPATSRFHSGAGHPRQDSLALGHALSVASLRRRP